MCVYMASKEMLSDNLNISLFNFYLKPPNLMGIDPNTPYSSTPPPSEKVKEGENGKDIDISNIIIPSPRPYFI